MKNTGANVKTSITQLDYIGMPSYRNPVIEFVNRVKTTPLFAQCVKCKLNNKITISRYDSLETKAIEVMFKFPCYAEKHFAYISYFIRCVLFIIMYISQLFNINFLSLIKSSSTMINLLKRFNVIKQDVTETYCSRFEQRGT